MQLKDQAAIVTGGASGLGAATARKLAAQGAKVAVCDLNASLAEAVAAEIGGVAVVCDVAEHAWATDYPRREDYVASFIDHLDWEEVARRYRGVDRM